MIKRFRHRGLKKLYERDDPGGVDSHHVRKLKQQLTALDAAEQPGDMAIPGWNFHPLKGKRKGEWAVRVSGNWRLTFKFDGSDATDVGYEDYH